MSKFLDTKRISGGEVIIIDDEKNWENIYGSNDSKSSLKPMAIILKKEIFDRENISEENISWLIHEIGHIEFYKALGERLDSYMEEYYRKGEYVESEMEKTAFQLQFEYLKSIGKSRTECVEFIKNYFDKSFSENESEKKEKELEKVTEYLDEIFR